MLHAFDHCLHQVVEMGRFVFTAQSIWLTQLEKPVTVSANRW